MSKWEHRFDGFWDNAEVSEAPDWSALAKQQHFEEALAIARQLKSELSAFHAETIKVTWINGDGEILEPNL